MRAFRDLIALYHPQRLTLHLFGAVLAGALARSVGDSFGEMIGVGVAIYLEMLGAFLVWDYLTRARVAPEQASSPWTIAITAAALWGLGLALTAFVLAGWPLWRAALAGAIALVAFGIVLGWMLRGVARRKS